MTIGGWVAFILLGILILIFGIGIAFMLDNSVSTPLVSIVTVILIILLFTGMRWYFQNTAAGQRALLDQKSNIRNGIERTVTVYTADGDVIAQYEGKIDIEVNDGGYVKLDFEGKRYIYYNCFVEAIANID